MATVTMVLAPKKLSSIGRFHPSPKSLRRRVGHSVSFAPRCHIDLNYKAGQAIYKRELEAAIEVVERACRLCISVQEGLQADEDHSGPNMKFKKSDASPVTVADLGVQALVSLGLFAVIKCILGSGHVLALLSHTLLSVELGHLFPSIPLVGEEDSSQLREELSSFHKTDSNHVPSVESVTQAVASVASTALKNVTTEIILDALDRAVKSVIETDSTTISYWILDPIDGTRGFLRGGDALYVVGLALVVDDEVVLGVMGCPNIQFKYVDKDTSGAAFSLEMAMSQQTSRGNTADRYEALKAPTPRGFQSGLLMAACSGCGCWVRVLSRKAVIPDRKGARHGFFIDMIESKVDGSKSTKDALFCISDNEDWRTLPLAQALASVPTNEGRLSEYEAQVFPLCCGSLCKYFAIALGSASVFVQHVPIASQVKVWDHAAGVICVVEAGGQVTDFEGSHLQRMLGNGQETVSPQGGGIVATNGILHELLLTCLSPSNMLLR